MELLYSRWWGDPAEHLDEIRAVRRRAEQLDKELRERELRHKRRRIRKLAKQAKAGESKGQR